MSDKDDEAARTTPEEATGETLHGEGGDQPAPDDASVVADAELPDADEINPLAPPINTEAGA